MGPLEFSTRLGSSFYIGRILILLLVLSTLVALTATKKLSTIRSYEFIILFVSIIVLAVIGYNTYKYTAPSASSLALSVLSYVFVANVKLILIVLVYHLPFAITSFLIYIGMYKYREFLMELKITRVPGEGR